MGIEPTYAAWEAAVLPLNYARKCTLTEFWLRSGSIIILQLSADCNPTELTAYRLRQKSGTSCRRARANSGHVEA